MPKSAAFFMKHVTVFKTSLRAVTAAHTIGSSRWKLCMTRLLLIPAWPESGWWQVAQGCFGGRGLQGQHPLRKARQFSSACDRERGEGSFPCVLAPRAPACFSRFNLLNIVKADVAPISETPHRSRKGVTSAASEGNLQGKHDFKATFFTLISHILSPESE